MKIINRCPHTNIQGIFGDQINHFGGCRLRCDDCERLLDGPVNLRTSIEWGVKDIYGDVVWFIPGDYVDSTDEEVKEWAEEYAESDDDFRLVRRYVTQEIDSE